MKANLAYRRVEARLLAKLDAQATELVHRLTPDEFRRVWRIVGGPDAPEPEHFELPPRAQQSPMSIPQYRALIRLVERVLAARPPECELTRAEVDELIQQAARDIEARRKPIEPR